MRYRLPTSSLKKLESRKFTKNEIYDTCAICLDDYEEGDRLRWNIDVTVSATKLFLTMFNSFQDFALSSRVSHEVHRCLADEEQTSVPRLQAQSVHDWGKT